MRAMRYDAQADRFLRKQHAVQLASPLALRIAPAAISSAGTITQVAFFNGTALLGTVGSPPYTMTINNAANGSYAISAQAIDSTGTAAVTAPVTLVVDTPLTASVASNASAQTVAPAAVQLSVTASGGAALAQVEYFNGSTSLGVVTQAPFSFAWSNVAAGSYSITAKLTDTLGTVATTAPVTVTVAAASSAQVYYIQSDHLNTPRIVTDASNNVVWQWAQDDPFGNTVANPDPGNTGKLFEFNLRFPGQYLDKETGLYYNYFRDYDPSTGRYQESDPIGLGGGINTYAYVSGNPVRKIDRKGLQEFFPPGLWPAFDPIFETPVARPIEPIVPPGWTTEWQWRYPESDKGEPRWFDPEGGEWRRHNVDKWHDEAHWDYNPWDHPSSTWRNIYDNWGKRSNGQFCPTPDIGPPKPPPNLPSCGNGVYAGCIL